MSRHFQMIRNVEFAETDAAGIIHFSNYFRWMESAEHEFFRSQINYPIFDREARTGFPRAKVHCEFFKPINYGDTVTVALQITKLRSSSIKFHITFHVSRDGTDVLCAEGDMITVYAQEDDEGRLQAIELPPVLRSLLEPWCSSEALSS
ncbi:MAG: acyl-CoA thioesterase [Opitutales bacterium]|nr:acyl-CoA thioesterase [Opitutales bacterium]